MPFLSLFAQNLSNGLVAKYLFAGNYADSSGNGLNMTNYNVTLTTDRFGNQNSAGSFNGSNAYLQLSNANAMKNNNFTFAAWVRFSTLPGNGQNRYIVQVGTSSVDHGLDVTNNYINWTGMNVFSYNGSSNVYASGQAGLPQTNRWYHIVGTRSNSALIYYLDGVKIAQYNINNVNPAYDQNILMNIGKRNSGFYHHGLIDDVYIYDRALSPNEIIILRNLGCPSGLIAQQSRDTTIRPGHSAFFKVKTSQNNLNISWQESLGNSPVNIDSEGYFNGIKSDSLTIYSVSAKRTNQRVRMVANIAHCSDHYSNWYQVLLDTACYFNVYDTTSVYDTTRVYDSINVNVPVYDTTSVYDTANVFVTIYDTTLVTAYDTVDVYDTTWTSITVYDSISVTDTLFINTPLSSSPPVMHTIRVYPNPAKDYLYIDNGNYTQIGSYYIKITNSLGQQVFYSIINQPFFTIDLSTWGSKGIYTLQLIKNSQVLEQRKIILQ